MINELNKQEQYLVVGTAQMAKTLDTLNTLIDSEKERINKMSKLLDGLCVKYPKNEQCIAYLKMVDDQNTDEHGHEKPEL